MTTVQVKCYVFRLSTDPLSPLYFSSNFINNQRLAMPSIDVVLNLNYDECAQAIRRLVSRDGVHGIYRLRFSEQGRFISIGPFTGH